MLKSYTKVPVSIQSILARMIEKNTPSDILSISLLWSKVVNNQIIKQTKPIATKNSVLLVHVSSSVWIQELTLHKKNILDKLNNIKKGDPISDIKFKIGNV